MIGSSKVRRMLPGGSRSSRKSKDAATSASGVAPGARSSSVARSTVTVCSAPPSASPSVTRQRQLPDCGSQATAGVSGTSGRNGDPRSVERVPGALPLIDATLEIGDIGETDVDQLLGQGGTGAAAAGRAIHDDGLVAGEDVRRQPDRVRCGNGD